METPPLRSAVVPRHGRDLRSVLVIKPDALGDFILASPFLRELRRGLPDAKITLVVRPAVVALAQSCPYVDRLFPFSSAGQAIDRIRDEAQALRNLDVPPFDVAILPRWDSDWYGASALLGGSLAPLRIAYSEKCNATKSRLNAGYDAAFVTDAIDDRVIEHEIIKNLRLLERIGVQPSSEELECWCSEVDAAFALGVLRKSVGEGPFVAFGIGASQPAKRMDAAGWRRILAACRQYTDLPFVLFGGPEDAELARALCEQIAVFDLSGRLQPQQTCWALERAAAVVCLDSFAKHAAAAVGTPVVEISPLASTGNMDSEFGDRRFAAFGVPSVTVRPAAFTAPCSGDRCSAHAPHCILAIDPEEVAAGLARLLADCSR